MKRRIYQEISSRLQARLNCEKSNNMEWLEKHQTAIDDICKNHLPHGSGFNQGTTLFYLESKPEKLVFIAPFHHMNENGFYDGWSNLKIVITPSLQYNFNIKITGIMRKYKDDIDYFVECFDYALNKEID